MPHRYPDFDSDYNPGGSEDSSGNNERINNNISNQEDDIGNMALVYLGQTNATDTYNHSS